MLFDSGQERKYLIAAACRILTPEVEGDDLKPGVRVAHEKLGPGTVHSIDASVAAAADDVNLGSGFTKEFRDMAIGMSLFPIDALSKIAARDFLRNPTLMIIVYLEWSSAAERLAASGQLSKGASAGVMDLAETLALAPAACMDYFDSEYLRVDHTGEHAGFSISGHILKNASIMDPKSDYFSRLPTAINLSRAPVLHAIRHGQHGFLAQPTAYGFLLDDWQGGGWKAYSRSEKTRRAIGLLCFSWFILPYNLLLLLLFALVPPLGAWYEKIFKFHKATTLMRLTFGLVFVPSFRWLVNEGADLSIAILFSTMNMMPFAGSVEEGGKHFGSTPPSGSLDWWLFIYLWLACVGTLLEELGQMRDTIFEDLDVTALWRDTLVVAQQQAVALLAAYIPNDLPNDVRVVANEVSADVRMIANEISSSARMAANEVSSNVHMLPSMPHQFMPSAAHRISSGPPNDNSPSSTLLRGRSRLVVTKVGHKMPAHSTAAQAANHAAHSATNRAVHGAQAAKHAAMLKIQAAEAGLSEAAREGMDGVRRIRKEFSRALFTTLNCALDPYRYLMYLKDNFLDILVRVLCIASLIMSMMYSDQRHALHQKPESSLHVHEDVILSFTVLLIWIRKLKVLQVSKLTGAFVYMVFEMLRDVFTWLIVYCLTVIAFSAGLRVLYRNQFMESGYLYRSRDESTVSDRAECEHLEISLRELMTTILLMLEITFDGASYWQCYYNSHAPVAGVLMHVSFMMFVLVVLVNALIAMMSSTYTKVHDHSFSNYVFEFSKLIIEWDSHYPAPFNLCLLPSAAIYSMYSTTKSLSIVGHAAKLVVNAAGHLITERTVPYTHLRHFFSSATAATRTREDKRAIVLQPKLDLALVQRLHKIRAGIIDSKEEMLSFQKAIGRYCRVQAAQIMKA